MIESVGSLGWPLLTALAVGGALVGLSKTGFPGITSLAVALFALLLPARESTAAVLIMLLVGDVIGVALFGRHVQWRLLRHLLPSVLPGLLLGALFLQIIDDTLLRRAIAVILLVMLALRADQLRRPDPGPPPKTPRLGLTVGTGVAAGFTTMVANASAPVMALYLLARRFDKQKFIGTNAWFFAIVNLCKVPLSASLGLFTPHVLSVALLAVPGVLVGAAIGRAMIHRVSQRHFEWVTLATSGMGAVLLFLR